MVATAGRDFSLNKEALVDNLSQRTLIAKRVVKDYVLSVGGKATDVPLTPALLSAAASSPQSYQRYLDEEKEKVAAARKSNKRKALEDDLLDLKTKRRRIADCATALEKSADNFVLWLHN